MPWERHAKGAAAWQVAQRLRRILEVRRKPPLRHMGVGEIYAAVRPGSSKCDTLDEFFRSQLRDRQWIRTHATCVDLWELFHLSIDEVRKGGVRLAWTEEVRTLQRGEMACC